MFFPPNGCPSLNPGLSSSLSELLDVLELSGVSGSESPPPASSLRNFACFFLTSRFSCRFASRSSSLIFFASRRANSSAAGTLNQDDSEAAVSVFPDSGEALVPGSCLTPLAVPLPRPFLSSRPDPHHPSVGRASSSALITHDREHLSHFYTIIIIIIV